jgi:hypothetical protein
MCAADGSGWSDCDCGATSSPPPETSEDLVCIDDRKVSTLDCSDAAVIRDADSKYWIGSDVWGRPPADTTSRQCTWMNCRDGELLAWGSNWNWTGSGDTVKAYPSVTLGWKWGVRVSNTGLPVSLAEPHSVTTGWRFAVRQTGDGPFRLNVAYDLWIHSIANPDSAGKGTSQPTDEIMVWLYNTGGPSPIGSVVVPGVSLAGATWDLWEGDVQPWTTHTFMRRENTTSSELELSDFLSYLVAQRGLDSSKFLTGVLAGSEIFVGAGQLDTTAYYVKVQ